jgi:hypothetical protein
MFHDNRDTKYSYMCPRYNVVPLFMTFEKISKKIVLIFLCLFCLDGHLRMPEHLRNVSNISFTYTLFF